MNSSIVRPLQPHVPARSAFEPRAVTFQAWLALALPRSHSNCFRASSSLSSTDSASSPLPCLHRFVPDFAEAVAALRTSQCGELNENSRGSSSSKARPQPGQLISVLMIVEAILVVEQMRSAAADFERALDEIARFQNSFRVDRADDDIDGVFFEALELCGIARSGSVGHRHKRRVETLPLRPARHFGVKTFARLDERREAPERPRAALPSPLA